MTMTYKPGDVLICGNGKAMIVAFGYKGKSFIVINPDHNWCWNSGRIYEAKNTKAITREELDIGFPGWFTKEELEKTYKVGDVFTDEGGRRIKLITSGPFSNDIMFLNPDKDWMWNTGESYEVKNTQKIKKEELSAGMSFNEWRLDNGMD